MNQQILVIDDSEKIHPFVKAVLSKEPVDLHSAMDAEYGLTLAESIRPDLILLDVDMPGMNGFEAAKQLKSNPETAECPIIFLTGQSSPKEKVHGFGLGAVDYITKPFNASELLVRVRSSLKTNRVIRTLERQSLVDPLTGLWNRSMFEKRIAAELSLRTRTGLPLSMILLDVDHFKSINDLYGHVTGDMVLREIALAIDSSRRKEDLVCRYGGDEFVIVLPSISAADAGVFAENIRAAVANLSISPSVSPTSPLAGETIRTTISVGIVEASGEAHERALLMRVDEALYVAKQQGRNSVVTCAPTKRSAA